MSLIKWSPMNEMDLFRDFDSMINAFFRPARGVRHGDFDWSPRVDVLEREGSFQFVAEVPGIEKKDIEISVKDDILTISGEKSVSEKNDEDTYYTCERRFGKFKRAFRLSDSIDASKITAEYKDGVLIVDVPKVEAPEEVSKKIEIK